MDPQSKEISGVNIITWRLHWIFDLLVGIFDFM